MSVPPGLALARALLSEPGVALNALEADARGIAEADPDAFARARQVAALADHGALTSVAGVARLFDAAAAIDARLASALYDADGAAAAELVAVVDDWVPLAGCAVLDFGCGAGRLLPHLAARGARVTGADLSAAMLAAVPDTRARLLHVPGGDLTVLGEVLFDCILIVDVLPYAVAAGTADALLTGLAARLQPAGQMLVFNWSYRDEPALDLAEAERFAAATGLTLVRAGEAPFRHWDGTGWQFAAGA